MSSDTLVFEGKSNSKWWLTLLPTPNPPIVCALEGSQHCHLGVWSIEGTDLILSPLTQHGMQKITWAIANADVTWGKPYVCRFVDRWNKDKQGKSPTMTLNTDTKTKQESCYSARLVMYRRPHRYKCTKIVTKPLSLFRKRHRSRQSAFPCRKLERTTCLATWAAHAAVKFGHDEQSTNKNKQTAPNKESENVEGLSIQPTFHMALREDTLHLFKIFNQRINFLSTSADEAIWVAQLQTHHNHQMSPHRLSCKSTLPAAPVRQLQGMHSKNCFSDFSAPWF